MSTYLAIPSRHSSRNLRLISWPRQRIRLVNHRRAQHLAKSHPRTPISPFRSHFFWLLSAVTAIYSISANPSPYHSKHHALLVGLVRQGSLFTYVHCEISGDILATLRIFLYYKIYIYANM